MKTRSAGQGKAARAEEAYGWLRWKGLDSQLGELKARLMVGGRACGSRLGWKGVAHISSPRGPRLASGRRTCGLRLDWNELGLRIGLTVRAEVARSSRLGIWRGLAEGKDAAGRLGLSSARRKIARVLKLQIIDFRSNLSEERAFLSFFSFFFGGLLKWRSLADSWITRSVHLSGEKGWKSDDI